MRTIARMTRYTRCGSPLEQSLEVAAAQAQHARVAHGDQRGEAGGAIQERELADDVAGAHRIQGQFVVGAGRLDHAEGAAHDDVQVVIGVPLAHQHVALPEVAYGHRRSERLALGRGQLCRELRSAQAFNDGGVGHGGLRSACGTADFRGCGGEAVVGGFPTSSRLSYRVVKAAQPRPWRPFRVISRRAGKPTRSPGNGPERTPDTRRLSDRPGAAVGESSLSAWPVARRMQPEAAARSHACLQRPVRLPQSRWCARDVPVSRPGYMRRALFSLASENALRRRIAAIDPGFFRPGVSAFPARPEEPRIDRLARCRPPAISRGPQYGATAPATGTAAW